MDLEEIESYFPIVFGHHSIAVAASIMYSPYAEQTIACMLFAFLMIFLVIFNYKRMSKVTLTIWIGKLLINVSYEHIKFVFIDIISAGGWTIKL